MKLDFTPNGHSVPSLPFWSCTKLSVFYHLGTSGRHRGPKWLFDTFLMLNGLCSKFSESAFGVAILIQFRKVPSELVPETATFWSLGPSGTIGLRGKIVTLAQGFSHTSLLRLFHMSEQLCFLHFDFPLISTCSKLEICLWRRWRYTFSYLSDWNFVSVSIVAYAFLWKINKDSHNFSKFRPCRKCHHALTKIRSCDTSAPQIIIST